MTQFLTACIPADMLPVQNLDTGVEDMKGSICTSERCPSCEKNFKKILVDYAGRKETELVCPSCLTRPQKYFIRIYLPKDIEGDPNRRNLRVYSNSDGHALRSYTDAKRLLDQMRREFDEGTFLRQHYQAGEVEAYRGKALFPKWLATKRDLSPTHLREVKRYIHRYYLPFFGDLNLQRLNAGHIADFFYAFPERQKELGNSPLSLRSQKNIMVMLKNFCRWLRDEREIITRIPKFPIISPPKPSIKWITREEQYRTLEAVPEQHKPVIQFMFHHPLRVGEARALKVKDFNLDRMMVHVERAFSGDEIRSRKNKKDYYVPLSHTFDTWILKDKHPEAWVFTFKGRPYSSLYLSKMWPRWLKKAGLRHIPLKNATRHSVASQAVNRGVPIEKVSRALGHSSMQITADHYAIMEIDSYRCVIDESLAVIGPWKKEEEK